MVTLCVNGISRMTVRSAREGVKLICGRVRDCGVRQQKELGILSHTPLTPYAVSRTSTRAYMESVHALPSSTPSTSLYRAAKFLADSGIWGLDGRSRFQQARMLTLISDAFVGCGDSAVSTRMEGNGKHAFIRLGASDLEAVIAEAVRRRISGSHVTLVGSAGDVVMSQPMYTALTDPSSGIQLMDPSAELALVESPPQSSMDIPRRLSSFRLVRPFVHSKLVFDLDDEPAMELLSFLEPKRAAAAEQTVNEYLEILSAMEGERVEGRPVNLLIDPTVPLSEPVVVHACLAALNPFGKSIPDRVVLEGNGTMHPSVKPFLRFVERLGVEVVTNTSTVASEDRLTVGCLGGPDHVGRVDSDPFFLPSQHMQQWTGETRSFRKRESTVMNCRPPPEDNRHI